MAVIRVNKTKDYTIMSNRHFKEKKMSLKAKGLLSMMLSLPADWDYSISGLVAICKENESAIKSTLSELKEFGYLKVTKKMPNETTTGRIEYTYDIYEQPQEKQGVEKQDIENLPLEDQDIENQGQLNTDNKSFINKKLNINNPSINQEDKPKRKVSTKEDMMRYEEIIKSNIEYDILIQCEDKAEVDELVSIMVELCCSSADTVVIGKEEKSTEIVKSQILKIDSEHIKYVLNCIRDNRTRVKNIKAYLRSCLFNAPQTIGNYYTALVGADMYGG